MPTIVLSSLWVIAIVLLATSDAMVLSPEGQSRGGRYFTIKQVVPALEATTAIATSRTAANSTFVLPVDAADNELVIPYSRRRTWNEPLPIVYTNDPKQVSDWLCQHIPVSGGIVGFDVESVPEAPWMKKKASFEGPATVQLATPDAALVVHLVRHNGRPSRACGPILEAVLNDASIVKAGIGIDQDLMDLYQLWQRRLSATSRLDLGGLIGSSLQPVGLQRLTKSILRVDLNKSRRQAMSDWSRVPLTDTQLRYSARDAWAGAAIVAELAALAPQTFGSKALSERLRNQVPLEELFRRRQVRKQAKSQLSSLLAPYVRRNKYDKTSSGAAMRLTSDSLVGLPPPVKTSVRRLKQVLKETSGERRILFDVEALGIRVNDRNK